MKLTVLAENTACREDLLAEHGLSLYMETGAYRILFDMGQTDAFARNAQTLGIDLSQVDFAVLSHGHYDHGGGLETFLRINSKAPVYVHQRAFDEHYNGTRKYIGLDPSLKENDRIVFTEGCRQLAPGITLQDCGSENWCFDACGLMEKHAEVFLPDSFAHEQYLEVTEGEKRFLFSGCSHRGIRNIARHFSTDVLVGGFHLNKVENRELLHEIGKDLRSINSLYYTGHCTGNAQFDCLREVVGHRLQKLSTGTVIEE